MVRAVDHVSFHVDEGETLGLVGESGCGKSVTALSLLRLVPPPGRLVAGRIVYKGTDLTALPEKEMRRFRGREIALIFQEPMAALNPVFTVGYQIAEGLIVHGMMRKREALAEAARLMEVVRIPDAARRVRDYPHQMSGGMRQRVMIALALACGPELLIADEPTAALYVTIQAQILSLLRESQRRSGMGLLLISHDLGVVARFADRVAVMYAGRIVEEASVRELFARPLHPYSRGLLGCLTPLDYDLAEELPVIPGSVPDLLDLPAGCAFQDRCPIADDRTRAEMPQLEEVLPGHFVRCFNWKQEDLAGSFRA